MPYRHFPMDMLVKNIFYGNIDKSLWCCYEQNNRKESKYKHTVDTVVDPMSIDEIPIVRLFLCSV